MEKFQDPTTVNGDRQGGRRRHLKFSADVQSKIGNFRKRERETIVRDRERRKKKKKSKKSKKGVI